MASEEAPLVQACSQAKYVASGNSKEILKITSLLEEHITHQTAVPFAEATRAAIKMGKNNTKVIELLVEHSSKCARCKGTTNWVAAIELARNCQRSDEILRLLRSADDTGRRCTSPASKRQCVIPTQYERASSEVEWEDVVIGQGAFGTVYKVKCDGMTMAGKKLSITVDTERDEKIRLLLKEFHALKLLDHQNIVKPLFVVLDEPHHVALLTELCEAGSLAHLLDKSPAELRDNKNLQFWLSRDIIHGMDCLHSRVPPLLHHDLRPENILLRTGDQRTLAKVADFGLVSGTGFSSASRVGGAGTFTYQAPELGGLPNGDGSMPTFTTACDVFAFGLIAWEILTGRRAWAGYTDMMIVAALGRGERPGPDLTHEEKTSMIGAIVRQCWEEKPSDRASFRDLKDRVDAVSAPPPVQLRQEYELLIFISSPSISPLPEVAAEALGVVAATGWGGERTKISHGGADGLRTLLCDSRVTRFLFSGHADAPSGASTGNELTLGFTGPGGQLETVQPDTLAEMLTAHVATSGLQLVLLNGCCSEALGRRLRAAPSPVPCVVCWRTKVADTAARRFAEAFFMECARGHDHRAAFEQGCIAVKMIKHRVHKEGLGWVDEQQFELKDPHAPLASGARAGAGIPLLLDDSGEQLPPCWAVNAE